MLRGPLAEPGFKGQFSGHETFPLRYGWLHKVYARVQETQGKKNQTIFSRDDAIISFGVGKNMVASIKHWGLGAGFIEEVENNGYATTLFADFLMGPQGLDPYLEDPASLWLVHWRLASTPQRTTTWFWAFSHHSGQVLDRDSLTTEISKLCLEQKWERISAATIRRDVECFIRTYVRSARGSSNTVTEDTLESPLAELSLLQPTGYRGMYQFQRGPKPSLPDGVFNFALAEFWQHHTDTNSLSVEAITYEPGSPGRVFKLDEESVTERLGRVEATSKGTFQWTDTAGVRQVLRRKIPRDPLALIRRALTSPEHRSEAA
jgi:hypothetical protein